MCFSQIKTGFKFKTLHIPYQCVYNKRIKIQYMDYNDTKKNSSLVNISVQTAYFKLRSVHLNDWVVGGGGDRGVCVCVGRGGHGGRSSSFDLKKGGEEVRWLLQHSET